MTFQSVTNKELRTRAASRRGIILSLVAAIVWTHWVNSVSAQNLPVPILASPNVDFTQPGLVRSLEKRPDGWLVGGDFVRLGTSSRNGVGKLLADGSVDPGFAGNSILGGNTFRQIVPREDGTAYAVYLQRIQRLLANGQVDPTFTSLLFNQTAANSLAVVSDGFIVGGNFTQVLTTPATSVQRLAKFSFDGTLISTFTLGANGNINILRSSGPDEVIVGGSFTELGGEPRTGLARISTVGSGSVVAGFNPQIVRTGGTVLIEDVAVVGGNLFVGGQFDSVNGLTRLRLAKLAVSDGVVDFDWNVALTGSAQSPIRISPQNGNLIIGLGSTMTWANPPAAGINRKAVRVAQSTGLIDPAFDPAYFAEAVPNFLAAEGDSPSRVLIAGNFDQVDSSQRFALAQVDQAGRLDPLAGFAEPIKVGTVTRVFFDSVNRRTYLSGSFLRAGVSAPRYIVRLGPTGIVDTVWRPQTDDRNRPAFAVAPGQGVFVAANAGIRRLNETDGLVIAGWSNPFVANEMVLGNDALYVMNSSQLLRLPLAGNGASDPGFVATLGSSASGLAYDPIGNTLLVSMREPVVGGGTVGRIARFDALTGARSTAFDPLLSAGTSTFGAQGLAVDGDGVWVAGNFTTVNGVPRASPVRLLLADGEIDPNVAPTVGSAFNNGMGLHRGFFYGMAVTSNGNAEVRRVPASGGGIDPTWQVAVNGSANAMAFDGVRMFLGGDFSRIGAANTERFGLAALLEADGVFAGGFE